MNVRRGIAAHSWIIAGVVTGLLVALPVVVVAASIFQSSNGEWSHLAQTRLPRYVTNTVILALSVCTIAGFFGIVSAWLVTMYRFPGRKMLSWAQLLPLAVPAYLSAYALTDFFQFSGPVQTWLREQFHLVPGEYWFPNIRSLGGAIIILAFALYPYVYFAARVAFLELPRSALEASRTLGRGPLLTFLSVGVPLARPALVAGIMLVLMETVADFGAVDYCAVDTFATGIYRTWFGLESPVAAAQLSALLISVLFLLLGLEWILRRGNRYHRTTSRCDQERVTSLGMTKGILASLFCICPIAVGFILPASRLLVLAIREGDSRASQVLGELIFTTAWVACLASMIAVVLAVLIGYSRRLQKGILTGFSSTAARAGYAIPGPVIGIGLLMTLVWVDHAINDVSGSLLGEHWKPGLIFTGSVAALVIGYQTRFLAVSISFVESGFSRIHTRVDDAARTLGAGPTRTFFGIHLPMMRRSLLAAGFIVFVDVAKELPITLMLRPFNFDTLAVRVYSLASDERLEEAATASLAIIVIGLLPVFLLSRHIERRPGASLEVDSQ